jgi:hypothetical protein
MIQACYFTEIALISGVSADIKCKIFGRSIEVMRKTMMMMGIALGSLCFLLPLTAQTLQSPEAAQTEEISEEELTVFAEAYKGVQEVQQDLNETINGLIADSDLEQAQFQEIYQAHISEDQEQIAGFSQSEQQDFQVIMSEIEEIQNGQQELMVDAIDDAGLTVDRFNTIIAAIQQDSSLYSKFMEIAQN